MAKRKASTPKAQRRPRAEIDRNYFFGDVLIKTGAAVFIFGCLGAVAFFTGRHLRHEATHWDFD
jgi:hypothetical protein